MIEKDRISEILEDYDPLKLRIGMTASHSALDICDGAIEEGALWESLLFIKSHNLKVIIILENIREYHWNIIEYYRILENIREY